MMENVWQQKETSDSYGRLFPMLLFAALLVIVLSALSVIALNGMLRGGQSNAAQHLEPLPQMQQQSVSSTA
jgi:hypothetical protein